MSFPRYPTYKDSGVEWLGEVPGHWGIPQIKRTTYLKARVGWKGLTSEEFREKSFAYLVTGSDFREKFVKWDACYQVEQVRYEDDPFIQLKNGDLLITKDGTIGKLAIVSNLDRPACLNSGIFVARPLNTYTTNFMYWILSSSVFSVFCDLESFGSTINHLYQNVFERFTFPAPSLPEQTQIAAFLDRETAKIDELVVEQRRLMELLKEKHQAVISHAVTQGLNPHAPMKDSGIEWLGDVPEHWEVTKLSRLATKIGDGLHGTPEYVDDSAFYFINGNNLANGSIFIADTTRCVSEVERDKHRVELNQTTVLLSINGTIGNFALYRGESVMLGKSAAYINCSEKVLREYLCWFMQSSGVRRYFDFSVTGTTIYNLSLDSIRKMPMALPPSDEQFAIGTFLVERASEYDGLLGESQRAIDLLQERRTSLISAAVTGQIDLRGAQTKLEMA